ncbi:MAG: hypothetical protein WAL50_04005 [Kineosporiaceae bacterium]
MAGLDAIVATGDLKAAPGLAIHVLTDDGVLNSRFHHLTRSEVTRADRARA